MPLQATSGAASYDGFGGGVPFTPTYIEDVFSTWLYTGNGSTQTITNGIDLAGKGGMVWCKTRSTTFGQLLFDTNRGIDKRLRADSTDAEVYVPNSLTSYNTNGFSVGPAAFAINTSPETYASWTFRKQPKFFDVVTYTGNGTTQNIAHSLGSIPGCIVVKSYSSGATFDWAVYHRSLGATKGVYLNTTQAEQTNNSLWNDTAPTSTQFTVGNSGGASSSTNANGVTYVAYLFAHDAGGFGLTGTDNVISCGSYVGNGVTAGPTVTLGYEPQFVIIKNATNVNDWHMFDTMRGMAVSSGSDARLFPNLSNAEGLDTALSPTATGFVIESSSGRYNASGDTYIYIAIRRGPMKTPTSGTSVYQGITYTGNGAASRTFSPGITVDMTLVANRANPDDFGGSKALLSRLTGNGSLSTFNTNSQETTPTFTTNVNGTVTLGSLGSDPFGNRFWNSTYDLSYINYLFSRAPGFFDVVCFQGNETTNRSISHNLGVAPELIITKSRNLGGNWHVGCGLLGWTSGLYLDTTNASSVLNWYSNASATAYVTGSSTNANRGGYDYVVYLFASCPGVSKVFSFTGNGSSQTINCGFTGGARFVMIKRTDSTGDWYVWDTARGIVANNDPHLSLNSTAAEVTTNDTIDTDSTGFIVNQVSATNVNVNGASYIGLAIA